MNVDVQIIPDQFNGSSFHIIKRAMIVCTRDQVNSSHQMCSVQSDAFVEYLAKECCKKC